MIFTKKALYVVLFLSLVANVYSPNSVNLTLENEKFGPESVFSGSLLFGFDGEVALSTPFIFNIANQRQEISLKNILEAGGLLDDVDIIRERYDATAGTVSIDVSGSGVGAGLDLRGNPANPRRSSDVIVDEVTFKIKAGNSNVQRPRIKIGDNLVYQYRGGEVGWEELNRGHLGTFSLDGLNIKFVGNNVYCQLVNVSGSEKYKLTAVVKKHNNNYNFNLSMGNDLLAFPDCRDNTKCCTISNSGISNSFSQVSCEIEKEIPETTEQYLCAYASSDLPIADSFSIRTNNDLSFSRGYISGSDSEWNFYIYGDYRTYDEVLAANTGDNIVISKDVVNEYINKPGCGSNCLLIPLNLSTVNNVPVTFRDLILKYTVGFASVEETQFRRIVVVPESARHEGTLSVSLESIEGLKTPALLGTDYGLHANFNGIESNNVVFDVVTAPNAFIRYGPFNPGIGEIVTFDASSSTPVGNRSIISYSWAFGEGTVKTGSSVMHSYNASGNYLVKLKIIDSENVVGIDTIVVQVSNTSVGTIERINQTLNAIGLFRNNLASSTPKIREVANLLVLTNMMNNYETELNGLVANYNTITNNATINESRKGLLLAPIRQRVDNIAKSVPVVFSVDSSSFSGGATGLNHIPSCCEFATESRRRNVLTFQKEIAVNAEANVVNMEYSDGSTESFMVIKKDIVGSGPKVYEVLPTGMQIIEVLNGLNFTSPSPNVYLFTNTNQLVYKVGSASLTQALQTRTILLPANLDSMETIEESEVEVLSECGNNICELYEDGENCPEDCKPSSTGIYLGILVIILVAAVTVYFGFFFKGGLFRKIVKYKDSRHLFKSEKDYYAISGFVNKSLDKKANKNSVASALKLKGWKEDQIQGVFQDVEKSRQIKHR